MTETMSSAAPRARLLNASLLGFRASRSTPSLERAGAAKVGGGLNPTVPGSITVKEGTTTTVSGVSYDNEDGSSSFQVTVSDTSGVLTISQVGTDTISFNGSNSFTVNGPNADVNNSLKTLAINEPSVTTDTIHFAAVTAHDSTSSNSTAVDSQPCYVRGTRVLTTTGEVAVEALEIGDVLVTVSGAHRPIKWIGTRSYADRFANANPRVLPICFKAGALGDNTPHRDLWVSPKHAMFLEGVLIPAEHLVNGVSIVQAERVDAVEYFHIELDSHDVIVAEGALSETFVEDGGRGIFHNAGTYATLYPDEEPIEAVYYASRVEDGFALEAVRRRIAERAGLPVPSVAALGALRGCVERIDAGRIAGWAQDEGNPDVPVCLDVLVDGVVVAKVLAGTFPDEPPIAGLGPDGAFAVQLPAPISGRVSVRRSADQAALPLAQAA